MSAYSIASKPDKSHFLAIASESPNAARQKVCSYHCRCATKLIPSSACAAFQIVCARASYDCASLNFILDLRRSTLVWDSTPRFTTGCVQHPVAQCDTYLGIAKLTPGKHRMACLTPSEPPSPPSTPGFQHWPRVIGQGSSGNEYIKSLCGIRCQFYVNCFHSRPSASRSLCRSHQTLLLAASGTLSPRVRAVLPVQVQRSAVQPSEAHSL